MIVINNLMFTVVERLSDLHLSPTERDIRMRPIRILVVRIKFLIYAQT